MNRVLKVMFQSYIFSCVKISLDMYISCCPWVKVTKWLNFKSRLF